MTSQLDALIAMVKERAASELPARGGAVRALERPTLALAAQGGQPQGGIADLAWLLKTAKVDAKEPLAKMWCFINDATAVGDIPDAGLTDSFLDALRPLSTVQEGRLLF